MRVATEIQRTYTDTQIVVTCDNCGAQGSSNSRSGEADWGSNEGISEYTTISLERIEKSSYGDWIISHELLTIDLCPKCFLAKIISVGKLHQQELE